MRTILTLPLLLACGATIAQPTLNAGSANPTAGDALTFSTCDYVAPGPSGAGQTWDHSALNVTATNTSNYVSVASTGLSGSYPNATVAYDGGGGTYLFYRESSTGYEEDGFVVTGYSGTCSDRLVLLPYPFTFGGNWTDNATCTITDGSTTWSRTMSISGQADGWGSIVLPFGTVSNVLRVHWTEHLEDNQYSPASTTDYDTYSWFRPGVHGPVFSTNLIDVVVFNFPLSDSSATLVDAGAIGLDELVRHAIGVDVWPNPAGELAEVTFGLEAGRVATIDLLDLTGQVVRTLGRNTRTTGVQREFIDLTGLPAGAYLVRVTDDRGAMGMRRLVKG